MRLGSCFGSSAVDLWSTRSSSVVLFEPGEDRFENLAEGVELDRPDGLSVQGRSVRPMNAVRDSLRSSSLATPP